MNKLSNEKMTLKCNCFFFITNMCIHNKAINESLKYYKGFFFINTHFKFIIFVLYHLVHSVYFLFNFNTIMLCLNISKIYVSPT